MAKLDFGKISLRFKRPNNHKLNFNTSQRTSNKDIQAKYHQMLDELTRNKTAPVSSSTNEDLAQLLNTMKFQSFFFD